MTDWIALVIVGWVIGALFLSGRFILGGWPISFKRRQCASCGTRAVSPDVGHSGQTLTRMPVEFGYPPSAWVCPVCVVQ